MRGDMWPETRLSCRLSGEMNVLTPGFRWKDVMIVREGWRRMDECGSFHPWPPLHQEPVWSNNDSVLVTPKPRCPADRVLMTSEVNPWQPGLKHYFGCQPSHHAVILWRGVTYRSQCLLWRLMWLEVLSRTAIFVLFLLHSWTAVSALWQPPRKVQNGLRARQQWTREMLRGLLWCPHQAVNMHGFLLVVYKRSNKSRRKSKRIMSTL